jgi:hypothetical protein
MTSWDPNLRDGSVASTRPDAFASLGATYSTQQPIEPACRSMTSRWLHSAEGMHLAAAKRGDAALAGAARADLSDDPVTQVCPAQSSHKCRNCGYL